MFILDTSCIHSSLPIRNRIHPPIRFLQKLSPTDKQLVRYRGGDLPFVQWFRLTKARPFIRTIIASLLHDNPSFSDQYQEYVWILLPIWHMPLHLTGKDADIKAIVLDKNIMNNGDPILSSCQPVLVSTYIYPAVHCMSALDYNPSSSHR